MFKWNYRIVNTKTANNGEDWYCLQEVAYNKDGEPDGYGAPCTGSEDMESLKDVWYMMQEAMTLPPLQEEDFVEYVRDDEEDESMSPKTTSILESMMKVTVFFEAKAGGAHIVAQFDEESTYMACLPALETLAKSNGYIVTESMDYEDPKQIEIGNLRSELEYFYGGRT